MIYLVLIASLFVLGSLIGYVLEVFYRRIFSAKKWVNPGFMVGPYIPLYGFGVVFLYAISNIDLAGFGIPEWASILIHIAAIGIILTLIELVAGLIFVKGMHLKLWDYSNQWGNFKGLICPLFSLIWLIVGSVYYFFINPFIVKYILWISDNLIFTFFIGIVVGMMIVDTCYSIHLGVKLKKASGDLTIRFEKFKLETKEKHKQESHKRRSFGQIINSLSINNLLPETIRKSEGEYRSPKLWWKDYREKRKAKKEAKEASKENAKND